jgi:hypothetical protein
MAEPRLFLDADGVLADFDEGARRLLGMRPKEFIAKHGRGTFWKRLAGAKNFYGTLAEMPDARKLFDAVKHLKPTILTGLPLGRWAAPQKIEWAAEHFPGVPIITCWRATSTSTCNPATCWSTIVRSIKQPTRRRALYSCTTGMPRTASGSWRRSFRR